MLDQLFTQYMQEKRYLQNISPATVRFYSQSYKFFRLYSKLTKPEEITKQTLDKFLISLREADKTPENCNCIIKGLNPFLVWLHSNEYIPSLKLKALKTEQKIKEAYSDDELKKIISFRPRCLEEHRLHTLLMMMMDTGARISELLSLKKNHVDLERLIITLMGKGRKERVVPMSFELRKILCKYLSRREFRDCPLLFPSRRGTEMHYQDIHFQMRNLLESLRIPVKGFHSFRRKFARNYLKNGGNVFYLQKCLGHSRITTTQLYVEVETEDLQEAHLKTSILSRLK